MAEFAQRPMVAQGMPPSAPNAVGTGITSGLVPENNDPIIQQGMEQFASSVDGLYGKLDQAESMEDVMNSVRGDEQTMETRVDELAGLVGEKDAKATPDSVLAVMQPYFQILEMVQSQASDVAPGGIADAPMAGGRQSTVNFNQASPIQAPGSDEAAMRMAMGEPSIKLAHGGPHPNQGIIPGMPSYINNPYPTYEMPKYNVDDITNIAKTYMDAQTNLGYTQAPTDVTTIMENQNKYLDQFKIEPRSREQILAEQQGFFGDQDQKDFETQGSLALAKFGAGVAQTPGSLLQALTANVPSMASDMSKVAAQKAALDRQQKEFAYSTEAAEKREQRTTDLNLALDAVKTSAANGKSNAAQTNAAIDAGIKLGIGNAQEMATLVNKSKAEAFNAQMLAAGKPEKIYGGVNPATGKYQGFRTTFGREGQGRMAIDQNNPLKLNAIPKWAFPVSESDHLALTQEGGTDWSKAQKTTFTIPNSASADGWQQVEGVFVPGSGYYLTPDGGYETAVRPPANSIVGSKGDVVDVAAPDSVGRIYVTVKPPNGEAYSYLSGMKRKNANGELVSTNISNPAYSLNKAEYSTNDVGQRVYEGGNPLVYEKAPIETSFEELTQGQIEKSRGKVEAHVYTLEAGELLLAQMRDVIGPGATLKAISTNNIAAFIPQGRLKELAQFFKTSKGREALLLFERTIQKSENLSDRYAVAEQKIISELAPKLSFFKDPEGAMVEFQKYLNSVQNRLANERHSLDPTKPRMALDLMPTGSERDPFKFFDNALPAGPTSHFDYLTMIASDDTKPADLSKINVSITGKQLEYIMRNSTVPNKQGSYMNSDGTYKSEIIVNANRMISLAGQ